MPINRRALLFALVCTLAGASLPAVAQIPGLAAGDTLRAAYIATNPTQATRDPVSGEMRGPSIEVARELARRSGLGVTLVPAPDAGGVIEAVASGKADIGFVAYAPARRGTVEFSDTYMIVQQTFIVPKDSPIRSIRDVDRAGVRAAGLKGESITLYMARTMKQATIVETGGTIPDMQRRFAAREIDAYGANRQRLDALVREFPAYRLLPDNLFAVPQAVVVPKGKPAAVLAAINAFLTEARHSGFLQAAIDRGGAVGTAPAPDGFGYGQVE